MAAASPSDQRPAERRLRASPLGLASGPAVFSASIGGTKETVPRIQTHLVTLGSNLLTYQVSMGQMDCVVNMEKMGRMAKLAERPSIAHRGIAMDAVQGEKVTAEQKSGYKDRFWIPRFWDGMCVQGWFSLLARNRFAVSAKCIAMAVLIAGLSLVNHLLWLMEVVLFGWKIRTHKNPTRSDLRHRALALRHDAVARAARTRPAAHLPRHLRLLRTKPLPGVGVDHAAVPEIPLAGAAADGQHARRLGAIPRKTSSPCATWASARLT